MNLREKEKTSQLKSGILIPSSETNVEECTYNEFWHLVKNSAGMKPVIWEQINCYPSRKKIQTILSEIIRHKIWILYIVKVQSSFSANRIFYL